MTSVQPRWTAELERIGIEHRRVGGGRTSPGHPDTARIRGGLYTLGNTLLADLPKYTVSYRFVSHMHDSTDTRTSRAR